jgi:hypothetical protein
MGWQITPPLSHFQNNRVILCHPAPSCTRNSFAKSIKKFVFLAFWSGMDEILFGVKLILFTVVFLAGLGTFSHARAGPRIAFAVGRPVAVWPCVRPVPRPCWGPGFGRSYGWNTFGWSPPVIIIPTNRRELSAFSSGFGTIAVPQTRIHKVPPPVQLAEPLVIHQGTSFQWKR